MSSTRSGARLFAVYVAVSLVPVLALGLVVDQVTSDEIDDRALSEAVARAQTIADGTIEPALTARSLDAGLTDAERKRLVVATSALHGDATVLRLRLRSTDGAIVFDADHPYAPVQAVTDEHAKQAASGRPVRELTRLNADAADDHSKLGVRAVETYVAFHDEGDGNVIGVLETYLPYAPFGSEAAASKRRLSLALGIGLFALWAVLAAVSWSTTRRLRRSAERNDWLAHHDRLTGLFNRVAFNEQVEARWRAARPLLVAVVDIARFREINDTLGHANGDRFLINVAESLRLATASDTVVARLGGDEFGVLIPDVEFDGESRLATVLDQVTADRMSLDGIVLNVELTVGIAGTTDPVEDAAGLVRAAELALHAAKALGASSLRYRAEDDQFDPERLALGAELGSAIDAGELVLHYQPKLDLFTGAVTSVEALVRWAHPQRGLLQPIDFIALAESTSLFRPLTAWVVEEAARQAAAWYRAGTPMRVSVNVSARSLADPGLPIWVLGCLDAVALPPSLFEIEITETSIVADPVAAADLLGAFHRAGIRVSLDDFGQGATSLVSLVGLPLDEIKVDRSFVIGMDENPDRHAVVEFVITLGHRLGLKVVAEGIETKAIAIQLAALGCDEGQGFLYSKALPAEDLQTWLTQHSAGIPAAGDRRGAPRQLVARPLAR